MTKEQVIELKANKEFKKVFQKLWKFYDKNIWKENTCKHTILPGLTVVIDYILLIDDRTVCLAKASVQEIGVSQKYREVLAMLAPNWEDRFDLNNVDWNPDYEHLDEVFGEICSVMGGFVDKDTMENILEDMNHSSKPLFSEYWDDLEDYYGTPLKRRELSMRISSGYNAELVKGNTTIKVGCQKVHIDDVRKLVKVYEELNAK